MSPVESYKIDYGILLRIISLMKRDKESLRELNLFRLEKRPLAWDLFNVYGYLKEVDPKGWTRLCSMMPIHWRRHGGKKLVHRSST